MKDVKARAGRLRNAWDDGTQPGNSEIETFLRDASAEIDAFVAARGYATPITDTVAAAALLPVAADIALLTALEATYPGGSGQQAVSDLISQVSDRVKAYRAAMASGNLVAILVLGAKDMGAEGGASSFADTDAADYDYWSRFIGRWGQTWAQDPWGQPPSLQPEFRRDTTRF